MVAPFRSLPSVDRMLADPRSLRAVTELGAEVATAAVRDELTYARAAIAAGQPPRDFEDLIAAALRRAYAVLQPSLRPVINASGVVIHTNLGRAPLAGRRRRCHAGRQPRLQQPRIRPRRRRARQPPRHVESLCPALTGAEAAMAVNNNASALLLVLSALGRRARGHHLTRPAGRDRRRLPHPRRPAPERRQPGRGGHHQPHLPARLRRRP